MSQGVGLASCLPKTAWPPTLKIVADKVVDNWEPKNAFKIVEASLIANNNKIDAILAPNDATAGSRMVAMSFCEPRSWTRVLSS